MAKYRKMLFYSCYDKHNFYTNFGMDLRYYPNLLTAMMLLNLCFLALHTINAESGYHPQIPSALLYCFTDTLLGLKERRVISEGSTQKEMVHTNYFIITVNRN